ncbi:MAG: hypothetical protein R3F54_04265 [Alphaproteobacteria bacterium]
MQLRRLAAVADPLRSLKQPLRNGVGDLVAFARITAARRRRQAAGDLEGAVLDYAKLVTSVQFSRESLETYRRIDALLEAHAETLGHHLPDERLPETLVLFVGQSRSGHSLVGSLIDAHPDAVIAHEIHALKHLLRGAALAEVSRAIRLNAHLFDLLGRAYTGYDYQVPGQWQGRCRDLLVIGDKKGNGTTRLLRRHPQGLARVEARLGLPIRFINVIRHPLDNIATKAMRTGVSLAEAARRFLANAETLATLTRDRPDQVRTVYLDALTAEPKAVLADLVGWLGLSPDVPGYLDASAGLVFARPKRTRDQVDWPPRLIDSIRRDLARYPALARFADEAA